MSFSRSVLEHHFPIFIVAVHQRKCALGQVIKKSLLCFQVAFEILVVIEVIAG